MNAEQFRLEEARMKKAHWKKWGPYGEQALGVDKRLSTQAMAIQMGATVHDFEEAELCCAPQFGSANDPLNFAGMMAANVLRGDMPIRWEV